MLPNNQFPSDQPLGDEQLKTVWTAVSSDLKESLGDATFDLWFENSNLVEVENHYALISSAGQMYSIWIEENFRDLIKSSLSKYLIDLKDFSVAGPDLGPDSKKTNFPDKVEVEIEEQQSIATPTRQRRRKKAKRPLSDEEILEKGIAAGLNESQTFDNFISGPNSKLAKASALALVEKVGTQKPLFYHAPSGLGKTHLLHAIGWGVLSKRPHSKIRYITAEEFANEYIDAIRNNKDIKFRKKYRDIELLLIDDIQFLGGKSGLQTEFFHTFNSIANQRNQIVVASDCLASELTQLEERLVSRLQWGMTVEISSPDAETSEAILRQKRDEWQLGIDDHLISCIVQRVNKNVRQLEGALIRTAMVNSMNDEPLVEDELDEILADMMSTQETLINLNTIKESVAEHFNVEVKLMESKRRMAKITEARQVAMFLCRELTNHSLKEIAISFAKDHASVVYATKTVKAKCEKSESLRNSVDMLRRRITRGDKAVKTVLPESGLKNKGSSVLGEYKSPIDIDLGDNFG